MPNKRMVPETRSTGRKSSEFIRATQMNTVSASGAMKLRSPCTMAFDWSSTISTTISTNDWKRPGTPEVALRAARYIIRQANTPQTTDQKMVSRLKIVKSTILVWCCEEKCPRWWTMYSEAVGACAAAVMVDV